ncbi:uncharacterized protein LOC110643499 [Hevea brasiliensis]|uniref:uncharacterized protein LOC110643499 n=1 Tax=Hevea brasiliensis TaxID=3981 RepID=UPI0025F7A9E1|nr:uncharacterized protein LOC110643499 [Hevea brasiliensis]
MGRLKLTTSQHSPTEKEEEEKEKEREYLQRQSAASQFAAQKKKKKKKKKKSKGERQSTANSTSATSSKTREEESNHLWRYVTKLEKTGEGGGNCKWICNFCGQEKQGTYTRVRAHLLKITGIDVCKKVMNDSISEMRKQEDEATNKITNSQSRRVSLPISITSVPSLNITEPSISAALKKKRVNDSPFGRAFDLQTRAQLDAKIAIMFYTGGLPFNFARNPYYVSSYSFAANHVLGGYVPPGYNKLRTTLLQQEKANVERLLEPTKNTWLEKGVSIVSDGWSDPQRRPLINFMVVSESGPMFIKSVDCSGKMKDKQFIANLPKENICAAKNLETNQETYDVCHWITEIHGDALQIKNFIMNHSMRLAIYNRFSPLKLLSVADTRFASIVVMLKRFKLIRHALEAMIDYIIAFTGPIYDMIRVCDTDKTCLHLVYELWDSMIEKVKQVIFDHEGKQADGSYSEKWFQEGEGRVPPHMDGEVSTERIKCFRRIFSNEDERIRANDEIANFSLKSGPFADPDSIESMYVTNPRKWWACFGSNAPLLQRLAFKVLGQPTSSSCCKIKWSIYSFIHSCRRNKLTLKRTEDLVFIHNNLRLLSRNSSQYYNEKTKLWDVGGDQFGSMEDVGVLEFANLSLDEQELESVLFDENATTNMEKEKYNEVEEMS